MLILLLVLEDRDHHGGLAWKQAEKACLQEQGAGWSPDHIPLTPQGSEQEREREGLRARVCEGEVGMEEGQKGREGGDRKWKAMIEAKTHPPSDILPSARCYLLKVL